MAVLDFFDPNTWSVEEYQYRIYADDYANIYAVVDQIDYQYLIQWRWKLKASKVSANTKKPKVYLARTGHETIGINCRICSTIFMHTVIMERKGTPKPKTDKKIIVDHADSDEFNCRRDNLRYATLSFNRRNRHGAHEKMLEIY